MNCADSRWLIPGGFFRGSAFLLGGLLAEFTVVSFIPAENVIFCAWLSSLLALGSVWGYVLLRYHGSIPLQSDVLVAIGYSLVNLIPPLYISIFVESLPMLDRWGIADAIPLVSFVTLAGMTAFFFGYEITGLKDGRKAIARHTAGSVPSVEVILFFLLVGVVVWTARGFALLKGVYYTSYQNIDFMVGRWNSITVQFATYGLILPLLFWLLAERDPRWRPWAWGLTVAEFVWVIPSGSSGPLFKTLFAFLLVVWWRKRRFPLLGVVLIFLLGIIVVPVIREYRYTIGSYADPNQVSLGASLSAAVDAKERVDAGLDDRGKMTYSDHFLSRLYDGQYLGYLLKHYRKSYEYEYGKTYLDRLPYVFIPYFLFTDRPTMTVAINGWFDLVVGSAPSTFLGEAYINFGYVGVPIMALLLGIVLAIYDTYTIRIPEQGILVVAAYLFFASGFTFGVPSNGFGEILAHIRNAVLMMIAFHAVSLYFSRPVKSARTLASVPSHK